MHELFRPIARVAGSLISRSPMAIDLFRGSEFKGKVLISDYVTIPSANGTFPCNGPQFELDFSDGIQRAIYLGTYERRERAFINRYVKRGWTCVDIGANIGFYTLHLARAAGKDGRVFAIEAAPANFARLERNIALNGLRNCHLTPAAITSRDGVVSFHLSPGNNSGWGRIDDFEIAAGVIEVSAVSFDSFMESNELSHVDFLKIDIEGHELSFLEGAKKTLQNGRVKRLMAEYCGFSLEPKGMSLQQYLNAFERFGFVPRTFSMDAIAQAKRGEYQPRRQVLNLLFEHRSL